MSLLCDLFFLLYAAFYLPYLLITRRWYPGYAMRFGLFPDTLSNQIKSKSNIWLHAVSVGEVMVIETLLEQLKGDSPSLNNVEGTVPFNYQVVLTVTTKTGYALALNRLKDKAIVIPSPLDLSCVTKKFVDLIHPKIYIAAETEIWPNLYRTLHKQRIPIMVVNGRISQESFGRYQYIQFLLKGVLNQVSVWCMQSPSDAKRIVSLGADASRVVVYGNIKFDAGLPIKAFGDDREKDCFATLAMTPVIGNDKKDELLWVAGSTHPGEEEIVLDVYAQIVKKNPQWRLAIVPRHVERAEKIIELVNRQSFKAVRFSDISPPLAPPTRGGEQRSVIVVDTIGHLRALYSMASLVFVGKSLCVGGGHNIIEPAFYAKPIVIGPKMDNFKDIVAAFKAHDAIVQVADIKSFADAIEMLSSNASQREILGQRAKEVVDAKQGATKKILNRLAEFL